MSMMVSFVLSFFPRDVLDEILNLIESVSEDFPSYSSRLISIRLGAAPFNITIIQVYASTSSHDDNEVDYFYQQLQETIDKTPKKDILVVQEEILKLGRMHRQTVETFVDPTAMSRQMKEDSDF